MVFYNKDNEPPVTHHEGEVSDLHAYGQFLARRSAR